MNYMRQALTQPGCELNFTLFPATFSTGYALLVPETGSQHQ